MQPRSRGSKKINPKCRFPGVTKSDKFTLKGMFCEGYKSTKHTFCGTFSHGLQIGALDVTYVKIKISEDICKT